MDTIIFRILLLVVLAMALLLRFRSIKKIKDENEQIEDSIEDPLQDLFFKKVSAGSEKIYFLNLSGPKATQNLIVLKNIFQSEGIPCFSEFEKFNAVYGGLITSIRFYILKEDYEKAVPLVKNYQKNSSEAVILIDS